MEFLYSRLLIYCSLLAFLLLLSLKWDGYIDADYWLVFSPLWLWKFIAVSSTLAASYIWHRQPQYRFDQESLVEYKSMMMSISLHLLILVYEVLVCDNLETASRSRHLWTLICIPLVALCCLAVVVCIWSVKHDRPFEVSVKFHSFVYCALCRCTPIFKNLKTLERPHLTTKLLAFELYFASIESFTRSQMELLCAVMTIQLIFIALQLDRYVVWSWVVIFIPLWVVLCIALIGVLYSIIFAIIISRTPEVTAEQKRLTSHAAISYTLLVLPFVAFLVGFAHRTTIYFNEVT